MTASRSVNDVAHMKDAVGPIAPRDRGRAAATLLVLAFTTFLVGYAICGPIVLRLIQP
jgi:hypothetical protein